MVSVTSFPPPGVTFHFPLLPLTEAPAADNVVALRSAPKIDPEIGLDRPLYKTFILSAAKIAPLCSFNASAPETTFNVWA